MVQNKKHQYSFKSCVSYETNV